MLAEARQADVTMAPAADMFEMGVKVQVLKRGTLFPQRAAKLYDLYSRHEAYDKIAAKDRKTLEDKFFCGSFEEQWRQTRAFFEQRDPKQIDRAERDPRHKMALVFRSYLGRSSGWAKTGDPKRKIDYQIWCGPAIGAFNEWVKGSFLEQPENRRVVTVALNLLLGRIRGRPYKLAAQPVRRPPCSDGKIFPAAPGGNRATAVSNGVIALDCSVPVQRPGGMLQGRIIGRVLPDCRYDPFQQPGNVDHHRTFHLRKIPLRMLRHDLKKLFRNHRGVCIVRPGSA